MVKRSGEIMEDGKANMPSSLVERDPAGIASRDLWVYRPALTLLKGNRDDRKGWQHHHDRDLLIAVSVSLTRFHDSLVCGRETQ